MRRGAWAICLGALVAGASTPARADGPMLPPKQPIPDPPAEVTLKIVAPRSRVNAVTLAAMAFGGLGVVAFGIRTNLAAQSDASAASLTSTVSGRTWLAPEQTAYDNARRETRDTEILYGVGSALVIASVVGYFVTAPPSQDVVIHPRRPHATAAVIPISRGAIAGAAWRF
nr:hypothetical protein [Kofleriaceae bacterium]